MQQGVSKKQLASIINTCSPDSSSSPKKQPSGSQFQVVHMWSHLTSAKETQVLFSGIKRSASCFDAKPRSFFHILNLESARAKDSHQYSSFNFGQWIAKAVILASVVLFGSSRAECETFKFSPNEGSCNCSGSCKKCKCPLNRNYASLEECCHHNQKSARLNFSHQQPLSRCRPCNKISEPMCTNCDSDVDYHPSVQLDGNSLKKLQEQEALDDAIAEARILLKKALNVAGSPSLVVGVAVDGVLVWGEGIGRCNMETGDGCYADSMFRIASISKPLTATLAMALWEDGLLDLDKPLREYLGDEWPVKMVDGEQVDITARQLLSHTAGIRHYNLAKPKLPRNNNDSSRRGSGNSNDKKGNGGDAKTKPRSFEEVKTLLSSSPSSVTFEEFNNHVTERRNRLSSRLSTKPFRDSKKEARKKEMQKTDLFEYYINQQCDSVKEAVKLFKDDDLFFRPGSDFLYSSHGYTLLSRVLEVVTGKSFPDLAASLFQDLGMSTTTLDRPDQIVFGRVPMYERDDRHVLRNVPYVDNSYKWAGGGFLSSAIDLTTFGTAMLYSFQATSHHVLSPTHQSIPGYLRSSTVRQMWTPHWFQPEEQALVGGQVRGYGLGWCLRVPRPDYTLAYRGCLNMKKKSSRGESAPSLGEDTSSSSSDVAAAAAASNDLLSATEEDGPCASDEIESTDADERIAVNCSSTVTISSKTGKSAAVQASLASFGSDATADGTINCSGSIPRSQRNSNSSESLDKCTHASITNDVINNVGDAAENCNQSVPLTNSSPFSSSTQRSSSGAQWSNENKVAGRSHRGYCNCPGLVAFHTGAAVGGSSVLLVAPRICASWRIERLNEEGKELEEVDIRGSSSSEEGENFPGESAQKQITASFRLVNVGEMNKKSANNSEKAKEGNENGVQKKNKVKVHRRAVVRETTIKECPVCRKKFKPTCPPAKGDPENSRSPAGGVVVAILANYTGVNFTKEAVAISELFRMVRPSALPGYTKPAEHE